MRFTITLAAVLSVTTIAYADVRPTGELGLGGSYTAMRDDYVFDGEPSGVGPAIELAVGARLHPQWSLRAFAAYAQFTTVLGFENAAMDGLDHDETTYRHVAVGGDVTWRPLHRLVVGMGIARAFVTEVDRFEGTESETAFRSTLVGADVGVVVYDEGPLSVALSVGLWVAPEPGYDHALAAHAPFSLGVAWN